MPFHANKIPYFKQAPEETSKQAIVPPSKGAKPMPPRGKPALPGAKPIIATAVVDELKDDIKQLKEMMEKLKLDSKNEIAKLSQELKEERNLRLKLQADVESLQSRLGST